MHNKVFDSVSARLLPAFPLLFCLVLTGGCAVGPHFQSPGDELARVDLYTDASGERMAGISDEQVPADWWKLFADPVLDRLQEEVGRGNLDLQLAAARVAESRAILGITDAAQQPQFGAGASYDRSALSKNSPLAMLGAPTTPIEQWVIGFQAGWEIDLWGHLRRQSEAALADLAASRFAQESVRVSLSAELAAAYLRLRGTQAQLGIAEQQLAVVSKQVALAQTRARNGVGTRAEVAAAQADESQQKASVQQLAHEREVLMNALARLVGAPPRSLDERLAAVIPLPQLPISVPAGLPSELARRRPDVQQAEARLRAAVAGIGAAEADFYPRIRLTGNFGFAAFNGGDLGYWDSRQYAFGPEIYLPLFEGGRLKQTLALSRARERTAALGFRQTVLGAWHEVANALGAYASESKQQRELSQAVDKQHLALAVAERNFREGASDYGQVLMSQRALYASQTALNGNSTLAALSVVALYKSLGGGWVPDPVSDKLAVVEK